MIRMLQSEDVSSCLSIYNWYIRSSTATFETEILTEDAFRERIRSVMEKYPWIVLEEDGRVLGYAYLSAFHERYAYRFTCDISVYVERGCTGRGYGSALMKAILSLAEKDGYYLAVSLITEGNTASEKLHEKCGFRKNGTLHGCGYKAGKWLGISWYVKNLREPDGIPSEPENSAL